MGQKMKLVVRRDGTTSKIADRALKGAQYIWKVEKR